MRRKWVNIIPQMGSHSVEKVERTEKKYSLKRVIEETRAKLAPRWIKEKVNIMAESEAFMKELYEMAKNFTPVYDKDGDKIVYFEIKEEKGVIKKCTFYDLRDDSKRKKSGDGDDYLDFLAHVNFVRGNDWSFFSLETSWPLRKIQEIPKPEYSRKWTRSSSTTGYHYNLSELLEDVRRKVNTIKREEKIKSDLIEDLSKK